MVRGLLNYLGFRNAPFNAMIGALSLTESLFYSTDNDHLDEALAYYRQREWRITGGYDINGVPRGRPLTPDEKARIAAIDPRFWNWDHNISNETSKRIDRALVLNPFNGKSVTDSASRIIVPLDALEQARELFGERVVSSISPSDHSS